MPQMSMQKSNSLGPPGMMCTLLGNLPAYTWQGDSSAVPPGKERLVGPEWLHTLIALHGTHRRLANGMHATLATDPNPNVWNGHLRLCLHCLQGLYPQPSQISHATYDMVYNPEQQHHGEEGPGHPPRH